MGGLRTNIRRKWQTFEAYAAMVAGAGLILGLGALIFYWWIVSPKPVDERLYVQNDVKTPSPADDVSFQELYSRPDPKVLAARLADLALIPPAGASAKVVLSKDAGFHGAEVVRFPLPVTLQRVSAPPLEIERQGSEKMAITTQSAPIQINSGFESSTPIEVEKLSPTHFHVTIVTPGFKDWFMFRIEGAKGQTLRIDLNGDDEQVKMNWSSLNPVYADSADLDDPELYRTWDVPKTTTVAWNGSILPNTDGQHWRYIPDCWMSDDHTFSFVQTYDSNVVTLAMRVPYTVGYRDRMMEKLKSNPHTRVIEIGKSQEGRPLYLVKIGDGDEAAEKTKPCVLIYAGEHADEQDAMWAVCGVIDSLSGDSVRAKELRDSFTFLVIPNLDPDAAESGIHNGMIVSFITTNETPEAIAYANWFQYWIDQGKRLDLVFDLHNNQSHEAPNVSCALMEALGTRGHLSNQFHSLVVEQFEKARFTTMRSGGLRGWSPDRLGGWLVRRYGALTIAYEVNSQAVTMHLNLTRLEQIGSTFAQVSGDCLSSEAGKQLLSIVDDLRQERLASWKQTGQNVSSTNAIESEAAAAKEIGLNKIRGGNLIVEKWIP